MIRFSNRSLPKNFNGNHVQQCRRSSDEKLNTKLCFVLRSVRIFLKVKILVKLDHLVKSQTPNSFVVNVKVSVETRKFSVVIFSLSE